MFRDSRLNILCEPNDVYSVLSCSGECRRVPRLSVPVSVVVVCLVLSRLGLCSGWCVACDPNNSLRFACALSVGKIYTVPISKWCHELLLGPHPSRPGGQGVGSYTNSLKWNYMPALAGICDDMCVKVYGLFAHI